MAMITDIASAVATSAVTPQSYTRGLITGTCVAGLFATVGFAAIIAGADFSDTLAESLRMVGVSLALSTCVSILFGARDAYGEIKRFRRYEESRRNRYLA